MRIPSLEADLDPGKGHGGRAAGLACGCARWFSGGAARLRNGDGGRADRAPRRDVGSAEASNRSFPTSTRVRGGSGMGESRSHLGTWARSPRASTAGEPKEGRGELH